MLAGLLVLSHDRQLLQAMTRIMALSSLGLRRYGGDFWCYEACRQQEREDALTRPAGACCPVRACRYVARG